MRNSIVGLVLILGLTSIGCGGLRGDCESFCDFADECGGGADSDCEDECVEEMEDADDDCQDSFSEFASCLDDTDSCSDSSDCSGEATDFVEECSDDLD